jgi:hypothetical protein
MEYMLLTRLLTMTLLSTRAAAALAGAALALALRGALVVFLTPPTGAAGAAGRVAERRGLRRRPAEALRWAVVISSRDWSSLPDILTGVIRLILHSEDGLKVEEAVVCDTTGATDQAWKWR